MTRGAVLRCAGMRAQGARLCGWLSHRHTLWQVARSGCAALRMHKPAVLWEHRRAGAGLLGARSHVGTAAGSVPAPCSPSPVGAPVVRRRGPGSHGCPVPAVRGRGPAGPGGSGPRCPGRAPPGSAGTPRARASPPPLPFPLKGPQRPAGRTLGSRSPPPAPSPSSGGGSAREAPVLPSPAGVGSLRGAGRGGGASPDTGRRWERGGERSAGGDKRRRAAGRRWMETPARRDARSSLECPGEPPPSGTGTRTGTREGARRRGNARASRRRRALRGRGREGRARLLREGRARLGAAAGGGSCHPAGLVRTAGLCAPCPRCAGLSRCTALRGAGRALPSCLALIYGLISQGTRLHSARFVI